MPAFRLTYQPGHEQPWALVEGSTDQVVESYTADDGGLTDAVEALDRLNVVAWYRDLGELSNLVEWFMDTGRTDEVVRLVEKPYSYVAEYGEMIMQRDSA